MTLVRYEPRSIFDEMSKHLEDVFGNTLPALADMSGNKLSRVGNWAPSVDIKEEDDSYRVIADLPGVEPKDIEVTLEDNVLSVKGSRSTEASEEKNGFKRIERVHGSFFRQFRLPEAVEADQVKAKSDKGVLEITIPKSKKTQAKRITVN